MSSSFSPHPAVLSSKKAQVWLCLVLFLSLRSAWFSPNWSLSCAVCTRGPPVTWRPWRLSSRDFSVCRKPDGLVCLQHRLVALPYTSTCRVPFRGFHGDWSTGDFLLWKPSPVDTLSKLCPAFDPDIPVAYPQQTKHNVRNVTPCHEWLLSCLAHTWMGMATQTFNGYFVLSTKKFCTNSISPLKCL